MFEPYHDQLAGSDNYSHEWPSIVESQPTFVDEFNGIHAASYVPLGCEPGAPLYLGDITRSFNDGYITPDSTPPSQTCHMLDTPVLFPPPQKYLVPPTVLENPSYPVYPSPGFGLGQPALGLNLGRNAGLPALTAANGINPSRLSLSYRSPSPSHPVPAQSSTQEYYNHNHTQLVAGPVLQASSPPSTPASYATASSASSTRNPRKRIIDESEYEENVNKPRAKKGPDGKRACTVAGCSERVTGEQLKRHLNSHLPPAVKNERHRCQCGKSYSRQDALRRHRVACGHL